MLKVSSSQSRILMITLLILTLTIITSILYLLVNHPPLLPLANNMDNNKTKDEDKNKENPPENPSNKLYWTLAFKDLNVTIIRSQSGETEKTFWQAPLIKTKDDTETIDSLYSKYFNQKIVIYDTGKDQIYYLETNNHKQIRIVKEKDLKKLLSSKVIEVLNEQTGIRHIYEYSQFESSYTDNRKEWKAIRRLAYYVTPGADTKDKKAWVSEGSNILCYIPIKKSNNDSELSYLEFDEPEHLAIAKGTNMCDYISKIGIESTLTVLLSPEDAIEKVIQTPEVKAYMKKVARTNVTFDHETEKKYVIHVYEVNKSNMTATFNWFEVDKSSGDVSRMF